MAQTITNQASLNYQSNGLTQTVTSNVATATIADPLNISKNSLEGAYRADQPVTYIVSMVNSSAAPLTDVTITDNLGTVTDTATGVTVTPLTFVSGARLFISGVDNGTVAPTTQGNTITFTIPNLPAGADAQLIYQTRTNGSAPLALASSITNTVTADADGLVSPLTATDTISVDTYADVRMTKTMTPTTGAGGSTIAYNFVLYNYGNSEATDIVLTDAFDPAPTSITVDVNGQRVAPAGYTYTGGTLTLPTTGGTAITLPPATITTDPTTGAVTVVPTTATVTVTGTL